MPEAHAIAESNENAVNYWKFCSILFGFGLILSLMAHSGPSQASASMEIPIGWQPVEITEPVDQALSIGGFDAINGQPVFVLFNESGQRIGTLPMSQQPAD